MMRSHKGFTLIEIVIAMLVLVIVFGILANLVGFSTTFFRDENTQVSNQTALRQIAVTFEKDVRKFALDVTMIAESAPCYTLGSTVTYCHDSVNQTITRDGIVVAKGIQTFTIDTTISTKIHLYMLTIPDSRNQTSDIKYDVYYRTERSGS